MGLDRRISVNEISSKRDEHGNAVRTVAASYPIWAERMDKSLVDIESEGGSRDVINRGWRIRWITEIALLPASSLEIIDQRNQRFNVLNIVEVERAGRRRYLEIAAVGIVGDAVGGGFSSGFSRGYNV